MSRILTVSASVIIVMTKWWKIVYQLEASENETAIFILVRVKLW